MLNIERYKVEIERQIKTDSVHSMTCAVNRINGVEFCHGNNCLSCNKKVLEWLAEEFEKSKTCETCKQSREIKTIDDILYCCLHDETVIKNGKCYDYEGKDDE